VRQAFGAFLGLSKMTCESYNVARKAGNPKAHWFGRQTNVMNVAMLLGPESQQLVALGGIFVIAGNRYVTS
jgi:hypothetical protein